KEREPARTQRQPYRNQQTLFISVRVRCVRNNRRAARGNSPSPGNLNRFRHGIDRCGYIFSLRHHWRYAARKSKSASGTTCLVPKRSFHRTGYVFVPATGPAIAVLEMEGHASRALDDSLASL